MSNDISKAGSPTTHDEKSNIETMEQGTTGAATFPGSGAATWDPEHRARVEKKMKMKLDLRCSWFILIYIMNYLDRNNIGAAKLEGLERDLGLEGHPGQFQTCLSILYVGYILMQVPSNIFINKIQRPSLYISAVMLVWGAISTLSGVTQNFSGMVAIRFFLGFVEAAFLPGALMILSKWYTRSELTKRNALLFCGNLISNAFSSLIGAGVLSNMKGTLGHASWRWLFWIEGAATMLIAILAAFILPDLPHNSWGFTKEELEVAQLRMTEDVGIADVDPEDMGTFDGLWMALKDSKVYVMCILFATYVVGLSFNAYFPSLTTTLGFDTTGTLLMSAPPWVFSCFFSLIIAWSSDRFQEKFWHIVGPVSMGLVGFIISMSTENTAARYVALFLQAGSYAGFIVFYSWISSSFPRPPAKRAVAIALINAFSQIGNIAGAYVWDMTDNGYRNSYGVVTAMFGATIIGCFGFRMMLNKLNRDLELQENSYDAQEAVDPDDEKRQMNKGFRYLV